VTYHRTELAERAIRDFASPRNRQADFEIRDLTGFANNPLEQNVDIRVIDVSFGRAKLETTALYTHIAALGALAGTRLAMYCQTTAGSPHACRV